ncbi:hypothetical protein ACHWQZ_G017044 [Mnemiopsis leidyi]
MATTWKLCLVWTFLQLETRPTQSIHIDDYNKMVDDDLLTYGTVHFDSTEQEGVIEVELVKPIHTFEVEIVGSSSDFGSLYGLQVTVEDTYCGTCGISSVCRSSCSYLVRGKNIFVRKYLSSGHDSTPLKIYEIQAYGKEISGGSLSTGAIIGIVVGVIFLLSIILYMTRWKIRKMQSNRFYTELFEGYAEASSSGEKSGRFQIHSQHPNGLVKCTILLPQGEDDAGSRKPVDFEFNEETVVTNANKTERKITVKFKETGQADSSDLEQNILSAEGVEIEKRLGHVVEQGPQLSVEQEPQLSTSQDGLVLPPLAFRSNNVIRNPNYNEIFSCEELIADSAAGIKTNTSASPRFRSSML